MTRLSGRLLTNNGDTAVVQFRVDDESLAIRSGPRPIGSWHLADVSVERVSLFRFRLVIEGETFIAIPDDPTEFAVAVGAVVDLREGRYGLRARIEEAAAQPSL